MTTLPGTSTGQQSTGTPTVLTAGTVNNFMVWAGLGPNTNWINFATAATGSYVFPQGPYKSYSSNYGPAFVPMADGTQGYVIWADMTTSQIMFAVASSNASGVWSLASTATTITGSKAGGGPTAALGIQNGQLVINIIWQDSGLGSMALSQFDIFNPQATIPFTALGQSCVDAPALMTVGNDSYLAYFDTSNHFNLAVDPKGGVNFNFTGRFTSTTVTSSYAPALVSLVGGTLGYVFWSNSSGVNYAQIGLAATTGVQFNTTAGCSGIIAGTNPTAGPSAQLVQTEVSGVLTSQFVVAWPDTAGTISKTVYTTTVAPNYTPIPA
jgi:hypothetical protein